MSTKITVQVSADKASKYQDLVSQLEALLSGESDMIANMANVSAALKETFDFLWVGFYLVKENQLVLGPFQGRIACTRIALGKGVCGSSWQQQATLVVEDVHAFAGHITCDAAAVSEVVVPLMHQGSVFAVLDVDSEKPAHFDATDAQYLEQIASLINP
jgi:L-methionine (R)-S-oxide reductase